MKKHLLLNQLFGTEGSPNQTGETLTTFRRTRVEYRTGVRNVEV
jgi:hypothetical protein